MNGEQKANEKAIQDNKAAAETVRNEKFKLTEAEIVQAVKDGHKAVLEELKYIGVQLGAINERVEYIRSILANAAAKVTLNVTPETPKGPAEPEQPAEPKNNKPAGHSGSGVK